MEQEREDEAQQISESADLVCRSLDDAPMGIAIVGVDSRCLAVNRRLVRWLGRAATPEDLRGLSLLTSGGAQLVEAVARAVDGESIALDLDALPFGSVTRGKIRAHVQPFRFGEGTVGATIAFEDQTEHALTAQAFAESEQRFRVLVTASVDGIMAHRDGTLLYVNPAGAEMFGYGSGDELVGRRILNLIHPDDRERVRRRLRDLARTGSVPLTEETFLRKDGTPLTVEVAASRATFEDGYANFVFFRDISERRRLQVELDKTNRMESLGRMAGGVAHDFNNLLTAIRSNLKMARRADQDRPSCVEALDRAEVATLRASDVVRQLLTFSRGSPGEASAIAPGPVIREVVDLVLSTAQTQVNVDVQIDAAAGAMWIAPAHLLQVVLNLLLNAIDAVGEGGRLTVSATHRSEEAGSSPREWVVLTVEDDGVGMDATTRARIFEPFFTTKSGSDHSGLGLSAVYGIVQQCAGVIEVESELGRGTTIHVRIPDAAAHVTSRPRRSEAGIALGRPALEPVGIVVCDDERRLVGLVASLLGDHGFKGTVALTAAEALDRIRDASTYTRLLVLDVHLRPTPARVVLQQMVALDLRIPVILSSGFAREDIDAELLEHPLVVGYLAKPYVVEDLAEMIRDALGLHPAVAEAPVAATGVH